MQMIEKGKHFILKKQESLLEAITVLSVDSKSVEFEYVVKDDFTLKVWGRSRRLPIRTFNMLYEPHEMLNLFYTGD